MQGSRIDDIIKSMQGFRETLDYYLSKTNYQSQLTMPLYRILETVYNNLSLLKIENLIKGNHR